MTQNNQLPPAVFRSQASWKFGNSRMSHRRLDSQRLPGVFETGTPIFQITRDPQWFLKNWIFIAFRTIVMYSASTAFLCAFFLPVFLGSCNFFYLLLGLFSFPQHFFLFRNFLEVTYSWISHAVWLAMLFPTSYWSTPKVRITALRLGDDDCLSWTGNLSERERESHLYRLLSVEMYWQDFQLGSELNQGCIRADSSSKVVMYRDFMNVWKSWALRCKNRWKV